MSSSPCILTSAVLLRRRCCDQIFMSLFPKVPGQVLLYTQASPPKGFPFFGMAPSALLSLSQADLQLSKAGSLSEAARSSLLLSAQMSATNPSDVQLQPAGTLLVCSWRRCMTALAIISTFWLHSVPRLLYLCCLHGLRLRLTEKGNCLMQTHHLRLQS